MMTQPAHHWQGHKLQVWKGISFRCYLSNKHGTDKVQKPNRSCNLGDIVQIYQILYFVLDSVIDERLTVSL